RARDQQSKFSMEAGSEYSALTGLDRSSGEFEFYGKAALAKPHPVRHAGAVQLETGDFEPVGRQPGSEQTFEAIAVDEDIRLSKCQSAQFDEGPVGEPHRLRAR